MVVALLFLSLSDPFVFLFLSLSLSDFTAETEKERRDSECAVCSTSDRLHFVEKELEEVGTGLVEITNEAAISECIKLVWALDSFRP